MGNASRGGDERLRVFIVRPWHEHKASLYPYTMDGVEYVDEVLRTIRNHLAGQCDVRVDNTVFVPGKTLRENLEREITDADMVIAILDGLRPNVIYELGFAYGLQSSKSEKPEVPFRIICIAEKHATVLVRNYYPAPMDVPTIAGSTQTILNPKLDICRAMSDTAGLLILNYDRLNLVESLARPLQQEVESLLQSGSKQGVVAAASEDLEAAQQSGGSGVPAGISEDEVSRFWSMYKGGEYEKIVGTLRTATTYDQRKVLALSLMRLGRIFESIQIWSLLLSENPEKPGTHFHLGICYYVIGEYAAAAFHFSEAIKQGDSGERTEKWLQRTRVKLGQSESSSGGAV